MLEHSFRMVVLSFSFEENYPLKVIEHSQNDIIPAYGTFLIMDILGLTMPAACKPGAIGHHYSHVRHRLS